MDKLIEHKQQSLVRDLGEYYFENWVKDTQEIDEFCIKIIKLAFINGDENRFSFMKRMIRLTKNKGGQLSELLAETYKENEEYLMAYMYSLKAGRPYLTVELLQNHIIDTAYPNEGDLFRLRAVLEYMTFNLTDNARICIDKLWNAKETNIYKNMANAIMLC